MIDINRVVLSGRLVADPTLHYTEKQIAVCQFTIASSREYESKQGTDFIPIIVWRNYAERCANNLEKGQEVFVEGKLHSRTANHKGSTRTFIEVHANQVKFGAKPKGDSA